MAWWLEDATSRHFGWVRNPSEAFVSHFWSQEKNQKIFFPGKIGKNRFFFGKNRDLSEIIEIFPKNRRFFAEIFLNDFPMDFSSPLQPITEKSPKNRPIFPIFCSLVVPTGTPVSV